MAARKGEWWSLREDLLLEVYAHNGMTWIQVAERLDRPVKATRRRAYLIDVQRTFASRPFTEAEDKLICIVREGKQAGGISRLAGQLDRTRVEVNNRALALDQRAVDFFTEEEDDVLRDVHRNDGLWRQAADRTGRSCLSVLERATRLGLRRRGDPKRLG